MRIAMLSYHTCPLATLGGKDTGGMNVYVRDLTRALGQKGVGVDVFTRSQNEHIPQVLHDLGYGNRVVHIPSGPEIPLPKTTLMAHLPAFVDGVERFRHRKNLHYDLIHSHYWLSGSAGLELRERWDVPLIHMFHTLAHMKNRVAPSPAEHEPDERVRVETRLLREADRVIAATRAELAQIRWLYREQTENVSVVAPGVDTSHFYPIASDEARAFVGLGEDEWMVLYVGRIEQLKGVETLLRAIANLRDQHFFDEHAFTLKIIGGDPDAAPELLSDEMTRLQQLCDAYGLREVVRFHGKQAQDTLPYFYSAAEVVVVPSHYESFGLVALEAMACGTPVIASETGGLAFLVRDGETGFHIPAGDAEALGARLQELLADPALRERIGRSAAQYARQFDWSTVSEHILDIYRALVPMAA